MQFLTGKYFDIWSFRSQNLSEIDWILEILDQKIVELVNSRG